MLRGGFSIPDELIPSKTIIHVIQKKGFAMNYLLSFSTAYLETVIIYFVAARFTKKRTLSFKKYVQICLEITALCCISYVLFPEMSPTVQFIMEQIAIFCICFPFETNLTNQCTLSITSSYTVFICKTSILIVLKKGKFFSNPYILLFVVLFSTFFIIYLIFKLPIRRFFQRIQKSSFAYKVAFVYFYLFLISIFIPLQAGSEFITRNLQVCIIVSLLMLISSGTLFYYDKVISARNSDIIYYQKNMPIYENLIHGIRTNQYDFAARMKSLNTLLTSTDNLNSIQDELIQYTSDEVLPVQSYSFLKLSMPLLAASLYSQSQFALEQKKRIIFSIHNYHLHSKISEVLLSDLANILVQNALEATHDNGQIYVTIDSDESQTSIEVRNPVDRFYDDMETSGFFKNGYSTKNKTNHGYGLYYLSKTVHKNKGELFINCAEFEQQYWIIIKITV